MPSLVLIVGTLILLFVLHRVIRALAILQSIGYLPGHRVLLGRQSIWALILPPIRGINLGRNFILGEGYDVFERLGWDAYSTLTLWPTPEYEIYIADAAAIKDMAATRRFPKPLHIYAIATIYGHNIFTTEGDAWKRYRKISSPSFSERNNKLVWEETMRIVGDLMENVWGNKGAVVDHSVDIALTLAILVISAAGFGQRLSWEDDAKLEPGSAHQLTFRDALHLAAGNLVLNAIIPDWVKSLHPRLRKLRLAYDELGDYMREMIRDRLTSGVQDNHDLFSSLIRANKEELGGVTLTEEELMGNIFVYLIAGHETTAHALSFTFGLLALYPEVQEKLFRHIKEVIPYGRAPAYEDIPKLTYVMAVYNESLRMFPILPVISKVAPEDTSLLVGNSVNNEVKRIPIPKGTQVTMHVVGVHNNPKYWENPKEFIPERFLGDWNKDAFIPFAVGPRSCLGRKFNETEGIAAITSIVSRYKIEIKEEAVFKHESFAERKARVLDSQRFLTIAPKRLPLVFQRRAD